MNRVDKLRKLVVYANTYGWGRTAFKVAARSRSRKWRLPIRRFASDVAIIGCGQFGFATIGYVIAKAFGTRFLWCYDTDPEASASFAHAFQVAHCPTEPGGWNADPQTRFVYICSNHASHTDYAIDSLVAGKTVYIEKPVAVSIAQLARLEAARQQTGGRIFAGYNRPFSAAVRDLRKALGGSIAGGMTLACHVNGHVITPDHWYRDHHEGTRICGNAGHWIDLFVHLCHWRVVFPRVINININQSSIEQPDDNLCLNITTDLDDLFVLVITSRSEPFEGIDETIQFQQADMIAKITDFRTLDTRQGSRRRRIVYRRKDVGHQRAILQPFTKDEGRNWDEILLSSALTITVAEMIENGEHSRSCVLQDLLKNINPDS